MRKYFSMFMMIDDGRPSLLPANRPSVRPTTAARSNLFGLNERRCERMRALDQGEKSNKIFGEYLYLSSFLKNK